MPATESDHETPDGSEVRLQIWLEPAGELRLQGAQGAGPRHRRPDQRDEERAGVDAQAPPRGAGHLPVQADPDLGRGPERDRLPGHLLLHQADRGAGQDLGRRAGGHQGDVRQAGHPRGRAQVPGRRGRAVRVRGDLPLAQGGVGEAGRHLHGPRQRAARARGHLQGVLRHGRAVDRQRLRGAEHRVLVGRLVRLRAEGRAPRHPAAGVLPHQRAEHGPVRAHADHRRRGRERPLRRRLHRADLLAGLAALAA